MKSQTVFRVLKPATDQTCLCMWLLELSSGLVCSLLDVNDKNGNLALLRVPPTAPGLSSMLKMPDVTYGSNQAGG